MAKSRAVESYPAPRYGWAGRGDINAFFGLMLDNIGVMILMGWPAGRLTAFHMPRTFVLTRMIPERPSMF